jgi:hypothetical protein
MKLDMESANEEEARKQYYTPETNIPLVLYPFYQLQTKMQGSNNNSPNAQSQASPFFGFS